jgi:predicted alpha/beta hydrolase family esterase
MLKKVFIVHGWGGNPKEILIALLKEKIAQKGFEVSVPQMPNTDEPKIKEWVDYLSKQVKNPDENTYFIGHSIGCQAIMRYLQTLPSDTKVGKCIFVAGWFNLDNLEDEGVQEIAAPWIHTPIHFNNVKEKMSSLTVFLSSNEPYNYIEENKICFEEKLKATVIILKNKGHFTEEDHVTELPEVLKEMQHNKPVVKKS